MGFMETVFACPFIVHAIGAEWPFSLAKLKKKKRKCQQRTQLKYKSKNVKE